MMIPAGVLIALAVAAPWYVALYLQHGWTYISEFFIGENLGRYTETVGVQARGPLFYLPVVLSDALPWSLLLPAVVVTWFRERRLAGARRDLRDPARAEDSITSIAARWGLSNSAHFSRTFRVAYGRTPSESALTRSRSVASG